MSIETVSRRYAAALADIVLRSGETENVKSELKTWQDLINSSDDLRTLLENPSVAYIKKEKVLESLLEKTKPSKTSANFLRLLLRNGRLTELGHINKRFASVLEERGGNILARVTSARELSDKEKAELKTNLESLTGKQVKPIFNIDNGIIGGVVTQIGSTVYDGSVKTQLENLKEQLVNG